MERLEFENYEEFACDIADTFDSLEDEFGNVSIIAKYEEAKEIIRELLFFGYDLCDVILEMPDLNGYDDEYVLSLSPEGIWCEKFKKVNKYITDESNTTYVMDNCNSAVLKHIDSEKNYEVCVGKYDLDEESDNDVKYETEHSYMVNGKSVDRETFNEYIFQFTPDLVDDESSEAGNSDYTISVKCNLDVDEALEIIADIERRMTRMNDMFCEMNNFRRLFNW